MAEPRRRVESLLGLGVVALGALASIAGGTACGRTCDIPEERVTLTLPSQLDQQCLNASRQVAMDGTVRRTGGGLVLKVGVEDFVFPDLGADIPDGTFVRLLFQCVHFPGATLGKFVGIQNLPSLLGVPNPTEDGTRLWHVVAGGGAVLFYDILPVDYALEEVCHEPDDGEGYRAAEAVVIMGRSQTKVIRPGEQGDFEIEIGEHAGRYRLENVAILFSDRDVPVDVNFRIRRAE